MCEVNPKLKNDTNLNPTNLLSVLFAFSRIRMIIIQDIQKVKTTNLPSFLPAVGTYTHVNAVLQFKAAE